MVKCPIRIFSSLLSALFKKLKKIEKKDVIKIFKSYKKNHTSNHKIEVMF